MRACVIVFTIISAVAAVPRNGERIVGGQLTTIEQYPEMVSMLVMWSPTWFMQECGGTILNNRAILSAAHCYFNRRTNVEHPPSEWRARVGSTMSNSGGTVHNILRIILHSQFHAPTLDNDIAILRTQTQMIFSELVRPGRIAGVNYQVQDNEVVWAAGWGRTNHVGTMSPQLRHVQIWTINQEICRQRYAARNNLVTENMLCSGWLDVGGRDQCGGDSGGPLFHNGVVVGVCSWGFQCGLAHFPGVNARVTRYKQWIEDNA